MTWSKPPCSGASMSPATKRSRGVAAWINKRVMDADRVILTGGIVYHLMAGFGAGRKAVMPGISRPACRDSRI